MILCRKCGHQNADDESFCTQCKSYLEWSGDKVTPPAGAPPPPPTTAPVAPMLSPPATGPLPAPGPSAPNALQTASTEMPAPRVAAPPPGSPIPAGSSAAMPATPASSAAQPAARPPTAAAPPARQPVAAPSQPASRQPSAAATPGARPRPAQPTRTEDLAPKPGDRICPTCAAGNDPARKFCRRCGSSLELATVAAPAARPPWYRRLFRRSQTAFEAGARPPSMADPGTSISSLLGKVLPFAVVVLIMGAIGSYVVMPDIHSSVDRTIAQVKRQFLPDSRERHAGRDGRGDQGHRRQHGDRLAEWRQQAVADAPFRAHRRPRQHHRHGRRSG